VYRSYYMERKHTHPHHSTAFWDADVPGKIYHYRKVRFFQKDPDSKNLFGSTAVYI